MSIRERLRAVKKSQVWLIKSLRERGIIVQPPEMSNILSGIYTFPKARMVLDVCEEILTEVENGHDSINTTASN